MPLTQTQKTAFKTNVAQNTNTTPATAADGTALITPFVINTYNITLRDPDHERAIAEWYNLLASPAYWLIRTDALISDILNNITWGNYTPNVTVSTSNGAQAGACSLYCQGKMFNIQTMTVGRTTFNATLPTQTAGLKDATTALPAGNNFANQTGGWNSVLLVLQRQARNIEKLLAVANGTVVALQNNASTRGTQYDGTNGNPDLPVFEGTLDQPTVDDALVFG